MPSAAARRDDPWTSWAAARLVGDLRPRMAAVAHCFDTNGPMSLERLVEAYVRHNRYTGQEPYPTQTEQSIRSRAAELLRLGVLQDTGTTTTTRNGRKARVLRLSPPVPQDPLFDPGQPELPLRGA